MKTTPGRPSYKHRLIDKHYILNKNYGKHRQSMNIILVTVTMNKHF